MHWGRWVGAVHWGWRVGAVHWGQRVGALHWGRRVGARGAGGRCAWGAAGGHSLLELTGHGLGTLMGMAYFLAWRTFSRLISRPNVTPTPVCRAKRAEARGGLAVWCTHKATARVLLFKGGVGAGPPRPCAPA